MNRLKIFPVLALFGLIALSAACAQMKALPNLPATHPEELAEGPVSCSECHEDQQKGTLKPYAAFNHTRIFIQNHRFYASTDNTTLCATCHKVSFCADCHTNKTVIKPAEMLSDRPDRMAPHRGDFLTMHKIEGKLDPESCYRCHGRANNGRCVACHR
ncbi:cytochrome C [Geomesophilobacter sediminis]|uniref:Cytochrome C n=1 Tax=Geomesophilobacter sediminis TaxID=2798584 RepID=A0A8J7SDP5_9BACT|nr:cytochrome C [Geomesophilobacter sediminis]MBJ6727934.1 cytochrome C [Geomesophilobacter sediminis]